MFYYQIGAMTYIDLTFQLLMALLFWILFLVTSLTRDIIILLYYYGLNDLYNNFKTNHFLP